MRILLVAILGIILLISGARAPRDSRGRRSAVSAYQLVIGLYSIYVGLPAVLLLLNGGVYEWASAYGSGQIFDDTIVLSIVSLLVFLVAYNIVAVSYRGPSRQRVQAPNDPAEQDMVAIDSTRYLGNISLANSLILAGVAIKLYVVLKSGGIGDSIIRSSAGARSTSGVEQLGSGLSSARNISGVADAGAAWAVLEKLRTGRPAGRAGLVFLLVLILSYISIGKRLIILLPILVVAVGYHEFRRPISYRWTPIIVFGSVLLGMAALFVRIFIPAGLTNSHIDLGQIPYAHGSIIRFYFYSLEFATVEMIGVALAIPNVLSGSLGSPFATFYITNLQPVLYLIPRALWPQKPTHFYDVSYLIASQINDTPVADTKAGYASTIIGTSWIFGRYLGVVILLGAFAAFAARVDQSLTRTRWSSAQIVLFAIGLAIVFQWFRQGTIGWVFIVVVVQQIGLLTGFLILAMSTRSPTGRTSGRAKPPQITPKSRANRTRIGSGR